MREDIIFIGFADSGLSPPENRPQRPSDDGPRRSVCQFAPTVGDSPRLCPSLWPQER